MGNGRQVTVRSWPRPSRSAWVKSIANAWLPYANMGKESAITEDVNHSGQMSSFDLFCMLIKKLFPA